MKKNVRAGLTLVELLVVLTILAVVTIIAVQSTEFLVDQARYNTTQQTLQNIQNAIAGPPNQRALDGTMLITGFVADMGRLPQTVDATSDPLRELWDQSIIPSTASFGLQTFPLTATTKAYNSTSAFALVYPPSSTYNPSSASVAVSLTMPCGWRGPYMQLSSGTGGALLDGWGNPFDSLSQGPAPTYTLTSMTVGAGNPFPQSVNIVRSRGADGQVDTGAAASPYNVDQYVPSQLNVPPVSPLTTFASTGSINVQVLATNPSPNPPGNPSIDSTGAYNMVRVVLYTPINGTLQGVLLDSANVVAGQPTTDLSLSPPNAATDFNLTSTPTVNGGYMNVPIGPRAIQAFQYNSSNQVWKRSPVTFLMVPPGGVASQTLYLQ